VFLDSGVFIYHFTGLSESCTRLLLRCEAGQLKGVASVTVLAEVAHRLMMAEAVSLGLISPGNLARKLGENPQIVRKLKLYQEQVDRIPLMGVRILPLEVRTWLDSAALRSRYGLLTNDSLIAASAIREGVTRMASADRDFARVKELRVSAPLDLAAS